MELRKVAKLRRVESAQQLRKCGHLLRRMAKYLLVRGVLKASASSKPTALSRRRNSAGSCGKDVVGLPASEWSVSHQMPGARVQRAVLSDLAPQRKRTTQPIWARYACIFVNFGLSGASCGTIVETMGLFGGAMLARVSSFSAFL